MPCEDDSRGAVPLKLGGLLPCVLNLVELHGRDLGAVVELDRQKPVKDGDVYDSSGSALAYSVAEVRKGQNSVALAEVGAHGRIVSADRLNIASRQRGRDSGTRAR